MFQKLVGRYLSVSTVVRQPEQYAWVNIAVPFFLSISYVPDHAVKRQTPTKHQDDLKHYHGTRSVGQYELFVILLILYTVVVAYKEAGIYTGFECL